MSNRLLALVAAVGLTACSGPETPSHAAGNMLTDLLSPRDSGNFTQVTRPARIAFPADQGSHPGYRIEWWYLTGVLASTDGREFGYQFTLFRYALGDTGKPIQAGAAPSAWHTGQVYMAHAALSDVDSGRMLFDEQFARGALGLAGVSATPFRAWLHGWELAQAGPACDSCFDTVLSVKAGDFSLDLHLVNTAQPVLHGDSGFSTKGRGPGNASYYYSYTRLRTRGQVGIQADTYSVSGESWFDHEWSSSVLADSQEGWDWFSLRLADNSALMLFRMRDRSGPAGDFYAGTRISAGGRVEPVDGGSIRMTPLAYWQSPATGTRYPSAWQVEVGTESFRVVPRFMQQEIDASFRYWEGLVSIDAGPGGRNTGRGYLEMTGYR